jgi:hypothetical protein
MPRNQGPLVQPPQLWAGFDCPTSRRLPRRNPYMLNGQIFNPLEPGLEWLKSRNIRGGSQIRLRAYGIFEGLKIGGFGESRPDSRTRPFLFGRHGIEDQQSAILSRLRKSPLEPEGTSDRSQGCLQPEMGIALISDAVTSYVEWLNFTGAVRATVKRKGCTITCLL